MPVQRLQFMTVTATPVTQLVGESLSVRHAFATLTVSASRGMPRERTGAVPHLPDGASFLNFATNEM